MVSYSKKTELMVFVAFHYTILTPTCSSPTTVLCIPKTPEPPKKEKRSSLRVKTERKFYRPGAGVDGKWVDNPTSPSEEANVDLDLINKEIRVMESRQVDVSNTYMNQQGDIWLTGANDEEDMPITKNEHGMYVENLEYDSDETREMTEEEVLEYEREDDEGVVHTVEENDGGAKTVVETVEDDDENDGVF
jgi:hypothetical protein